MIDHIYIHIPFCLRKCNYCSFYSVEFSSILKEKYLTSLLREIEFYQQKFEIKPKTIYFGGGTPSLLSTEDLNNILSKFDLSDIKEITLEVNPININEEYAGELSQTSINRISLGVQSFLDNELKLLGRLHDSNKVYSAYESLRNSGFENISFDLIYGLPNQKLADIEFSLKKMIELEPEHISTYCLSLEEDVPLFMKKSEMPDDETISKFYHFIREELIPTGYEQYEISNFAKSGFESKHNLSYWNDRSYSGFGPAASGYLKYCHPERSRRIFRYTNPADLEEYHDLIKISQVFGKMLSLSEADHEKEFIFLSLRKTKGLDLKKYRMDFGADFLQKYEKVIAKYLEGKYLEIESDCIRLTPKAYFVSNEIFTEFV